MPKRILLQVLILVIAIDLPAQVACEVDQLKTVEDIEPTVTACRADAKNNGFPQLHRFLAEKVKLCIGSSYTSKDVSSHLVDCNRENIQNAIEIMTCTQSLKRYDEAVQSDLIISNKIFKPDPKLEASAAVKAVFSKLTAAAEILSPAKFRSPNWSLTVFESPMVNATAGAGGLIFASSGLWNGPSALQLPEVAAVLAHEAAHVVLEHSLQQGCLALEWIGSDHTIHSATEVFREDILSAVERKEAWMNLSQANEKEADAFAVKLLKHSGLDPKGMLRLLEALRPKNAPGFSSGSHPNIEDRISNVRRALLNP